MLKKNKEEGLREILADIARHARELLSRFQQHYDDVALIRDMLSPDGNNGCVKLGKLKRYLLQFGPGEIPATWLTEWHSDSMRLIEEVRMRYPEVDSLHKCWNAQKGLYDLLTVRYAEYETNDAYNEEISHKADVLKGLYRENSNGFHNLLVKRISEVKSKKCGRDRTANRETARRREETRRILEAICSYRAKAAENGRNISYLRAVTEMKNGTYAARLRGKKLSTWANQASAYGKKNRFVTPVVTPVKTVATPVVTPVKTVAAPVVTPVKAIVTPVRAEVNVEQKVLSALANGDLSTSEIAKIVCVSQSKNMRRRYLRNLMNAGLVEYTLPHKPNSRLQKYRLTNLGMRKISN